MEHEHSSLNITAHHIWGENSQFKFLYKSLEDKNPGHKIPPISNNNSSQTRAYGLTGWASKQGGCGFVLGNLQIVI